MKNYQKTLATLVKLKFLLIVLLPSFSYAQHFTGTMNSFQKYDHDGDGIPEINGLEYVSFDAGSKSPSTESELVLVLIEDRLFEHIPNSKYSEIQFTQQLKRYKTDLQNDGLDSRFIITNIYDGHEHQDGLTIIALREWIKKVYANWNLKAVILVGNFPDAMLVRRWIWRKENKDININGKPQKDVDYLRIVPEIVSDRTDLVLADLDGRWDKIYVKEKIGLEYIEAIPDSSIDDDWPNDQDMFVSSSFNIGVKHFEDFFWIDDDDFIKAEPHSEYLKLWLKPGLLNPEISTSDKTKPNPIANPEILVSRINPYHIAVAFGYPLASGLNFLDEEGKPRKYETTDLLSKANYIKRDEAFERKLLMEYFDRNHNFRSGDYTDSYRNAAAISYGAGVDNAPDLLKYLQKGIQNPQNSFIRKSADLLNYLSFLQYNANLKGVVAHSSSLSSEFGKVDDLKYFQKQLGNDIYRWKRSQNGSNYTYTPTLEGHTGRADAYFHRTIYENNILSNTNPCFYIHMGCQVNSPEKFTVLGYSDVRYSNMTGEQNSESILFFTKGLAIASRAKVFNDRPNGFTIELGSSLDKRFGEGLVAYHTKESHNASLANNHSQCKRPYTWSIHGDCTLKLKYGIMDGE